MKTRTDGRDTLAYMLDALPGPPRPHDAPPEPAPLVACVDSSDELVEFLRDVFVGYDYRAVPYTTSLSEGSDKLVAFLGQLRPDAVVYAVSFPYPESWAEFGAVRAALPELCWVVTTTNKRALEELVGPTETLEIVGKPFDLDAIVDAVGRALRGRRA